MLEFEKKVMLSESEYNFLLHNICNKKKTIIQTNYYYDTDAFEMSGRGITCRIREKNGVYTATVKDHRLKGTDCSIENSRVIKNRCDDSIFRDMGIHYQGHLETFRSIYEKDHGIKIMLDSNIYIASVDYELEIEYEKCAEKLAEKEINRIAYNLMKAKLITDVKDFTKRIGQGKSKSGRFFERKEEIERWLP